MMSFKSLVILAGLVPAVAMADRVLHQGEVTVQKINGQIRVFLSPPPSSALPCDMGSASVSFSPQQIERINPDMQAVEAGLKSGAAVLMTGDGILMPLMYGVTTASVCVGSAAAASGGTATGPALAGCALLGLGTQIGAYLGNEALLNQAGLDLTQNMMLYNIKASSSMLAEGQHVTFNTFTQNYDALGNALCQLDIGHCLNHFGNVMRNNHGAFLPPGKEPDDFPSCHHASSLSTSTSREVPYRPVDQPVIQFLQGQSAENR